MKCVLAVLSVLLGLAIPAQGARSVIVTSQDQTLATATDCESFATQNSTSLAVHLTSEEQRALPAVPRKLLRIYASDQGGVSVRGWDRKDARVLICKCAAAETAAKARAALDAVTVTIANDEIRTTGPATSETLTWWTHMIVQVPSRISVAVHSTDGGIAIRNVSGSIYAATMNGSILLDRVSGAVDARSENGPISLKVKGPVVPTIVALTEQNGTILCHLPSCRNGSGAWTADRRQLSLYGEGFPVRLATGGSPIVIDQLQ